MKTIMLVLVCFSFSFSQSLEQLKSHCDSIRAQCEANWSLKCEREVRILEAKIERFSPTTDENYNSSFAINNQSSYAETGRCLKISGYSLLFCSALSIGSGVAILNKKSELSVVLSISGGLCFLISAYNLIEAGEALK